MREPSALAVARFSRGWTQRELARRAGVNRNTISRVEVGELPTLRIALKIADALDADVSTLFLADRDTERTGA